MTRISSYIIDQNIVGNDKWIGSDAQNNLRTKNFTPNNLADYFNGNNVIDIGTSIRYRYQTLDIGEDREQGTISFETEIGPQVNFSDITTFLIAKNTLKGNTVTEYLDFLVDGKVILSKSSNINTFGYYKVTSIEPWIVDPNFFVVVVEFLDGNGFIYEDLDYLVSLVDKVSGSVVQGLNDVLTINNESTTQDAIFRLDADKYIKIDRANQKIELFDPTIKAVGACAWIDANGFHSADDIVGQLDVASNYFAYNGLGSVLNFSVDGININNGGQDAQYLPNGVVLQQSGSDAQYLIDKISVNNVDYPLPTGATSQIATLLDIPSLTGYVPYTGATADVNLGEFGLLTGNIEFDNTPTNIPTAAGSMYWNDSDGTTNLILKGGNVTLQVGQEQLIRVVNKTATNVNLLEANYQAVRVTGAQGQRLKVDLAQATNDLLSAETIGLVTETINNNQEGFITTSGLVRNINTTGSIQGESWADGDILYLSPTTPGMATKVKPVAPDHLVILGYVVHAHITQGSIFVKVDNGYELDELHNVKITSPQGGQSLIYNSSLQVWENKAILDYTNNFLLMGG